MKKVVGPVDNNDYIGGNHITAVNLSATLPNILEGLDNLDVGISLMQLIFGVLIMIAP